MMHGQAGVVNLFDNEIDETVYISVKLHFMGALLTLDFRGQAKENQRF